MPAPLPKLSLLTDLTHNLEHHQTEADIQYWREELKSWLLDQKKLHSTPDSLHSDGTRSDSRWWSPKWNEAKAESLPRTKPSRSLLQSSILPTQPSASRGDRSSEDNFRRVLDLPSYLPDIHVAWDGLVVHFMADNA